MYPDAGHHEHNADTQTVSFPEINAHGVLEKTAVCVIPGIRVYAGLTVSVSGRHKPYLILGAFSKLTNSVNLVVFWTPLF